MSSHDFTLQLLIRNRTCTLHDVVAYSISIYVVLLSVQCAIAQVRAHTRRALHRQSPAPFSPCLEFVCLAAVGGAGFLKVRFLFWWSYTRILAIGLSGKSSWQKFP